MATSSIPPTKRCTKCGNEYPATTEFFHHRKDRGRLRSRCIACTREDNRRSIAAQRHKNPEQARERGRKYAKAFRERHAEKVRADDRARRRERWLENPEKERERERLRFRRRNAKNPVPHRLKSRRGNHKRRQLKYQNTNGVHYTALDVQVQFKAQRGRCWWCGESLDDEYHIDHRIPLSRGGNNTAENICLTCAECNLTKSNKLPWEWGERLL